ncbi:transposase family protein [Streptomyces sp. NPDC057939]|uniref:transposase family protein n=1 Tax=Streptomyces sp. NPDC057939 TaxID=3346284 RepID=UPI0036E3AFF4
MVIHPAALDLPHALVEWVAMLVVAREGYRRAMVALVYLREHTTLAKIAAGFGISESTAHAYTHAVVDLLAERAPGLLKTLCEHDPDFILLDGTLAECDRVGDGRADHSHKHRRHGVNVQVVTDPGGRLLWLSPALPDRTHEKSLNRALAAARAPVERGVASLKCWRIFRRSRCSPNRMTSIVKAILTLERQRSRSLWALRLAITAI